MTIEQAVGLGALVAAILNIIKKLKVIPDGYAGWFAVALNVIAFGLLAFGGQAGWDLKSLDGFLGLVAQLLAAVGGSLVTHLAGRKMGLPTFR